MYHYTLAKLCPLASFYKGPIASLRLSTCTVPLNPGRGKKVDAFHPAISFFLTKGTFKQKHIHHATAML